MDKKSQPAKHKITKKTKSAKGYIKTPIFRKIYLTFSLLVITATSVYWSLLGARLQIGNADQLSDPDLFKSIATLKGATFPGAHSMLIKWPIFWLANLFGSTTAAIEALTVVLVLLTIGILLTIIHKIERRPIVFGTICLALASVLLLVPFVPYAGALLPLNMAMLTTRNIEYVVFIFSLILLIRSPRVKSLGFWLSAVVLSLLIASDKLFLLFAIGGALITLAIYTKLKVWSMANLAVNLIVVGALAAVGSYLILALISGLGLTHLTSALSASPYNLTNNLKDISLGTFYAVLGILTNFGANPAFAATEVRNVPTQAFNHLHSFAGPGYVVNLAILLIGLFAAYKVSLSGWRKGKLSATRPVNKSRTLSILLIGVSLAALISFIVTNHYYAVDARYLTIVLFAVFIGFAAYSRGLKWHPEILVAAGLVITIGIVFGVIGSTKNYHADQTALADQNNRNLAISQVLTEHHDDLLVGDYWRVLPIKQDYGKNLTVTPQSSCTHPLYALSSTAWQPNLNKNKFVYLLTINGNLTNYPNCSLNQVISAYGRPNRSTLISGSLTKPNELLLFYDHGIHKSAAATHTSSSLSTVSPIPLSALPYTTCNSPSVVNIVAHEDDDLLFMSPDLITNIKAGDCVRTIYVTSGNAGLGEFYWIGREDGSEAAYSYMDGTSNIWVQRIVELAPNEFVTIANPRSNSKISLILMNLPDGNLKGQGFSSSNFESLVKLKNHQISVIHTVDHQSSYTSAQLISALSTLTNLYAPSQINTQSGVIGTKFPDHSDHLTVNWFVNQAYAQYETQIFNNHVTIPINYYEGYPVRQSPANVSGVLLQEKDAAFLAYAKYDANVCQTLQLCLQTPSYNGYLARQYTSPY